MAAYELHDGQTFEATSFTEFLASQSDLGTKWAPRYIRITTLPVGATNKIDKIITGHQNGNDVSSTGYVGFMIPFPGPGAAGRSGR
jgi:hypothetical protein